MSFFINFNKKKMKIINFKLSKRLNEWWYLNDVETEYCHYSDTDNKECFNIERSSRIEEGEYYTIWEHNISEYPVFKKYKTLTLEEAKDLIYKKFPEEDVSDYIKWYSKEEIFYFSIEDIENMLEYLLDNYLITKK